LQYKLYNQLEKFYNIVNKPFTGLGLIVTDNAEKLPIYSLYKYTNTYEKNLVKQLIELSKLESSYHDGFHILSSSLELTHISQYFYPQPPIDLSIELEEGKGVRYLVAKIGSTLPSVLYTAIVSNNYGICIFKNGIKLKVN